MKLKTNDKPTQTKCRALSRAFMEMLDPSKGVYGKLVEIAQKIKDLHLEFHGQLDVNNQEKDRPRDELISIYYKGNSILALHPDGKFQIHEKFLKKTSLPAYLRSHADVDEYVNQLPQIMFNVVTFEKTSMEIEYEQMIIRANNFEPRNNSEYIVVYNQHRYFTELELDGKKNFEQGRFDLLAVKWPRESHRNATGQLTLIEVKYALNPEISYAHEQLTRYYEYLKNNYDILCREMELVLRQKIALGLIKRTPQQQKKLEIFQLDKRLGTAEIMLFLVDYNPYSKWEEDMLVEAAKMPFANQIRIVHGGLALWQKPKISFKLCPTSFVS
ncbi:MAG: hypothetical protein WCA51_02100 [Dehalococcoidia bacterium]